MGAADVVPGVSGGTIAFISGIYNELINSINEFNKKQVYLKRVAEIDENVHGVYYRIPEMGLVRLLLDEKLIAEKKVLIAQFGEVHPLNPTYLNGNYNIEFYPKLGAIKQIIKKNP